MFKRNRDAYIERLHGIYHKNIKSSGVEYVQGMAAFVDDKVAEIKETN